MSRTDTTTPVWDVASTAANTVQTGVWTQLTATWKQTGGVMRLYVNGVDAGTATHTTTWNATGNFRAGAKKTGASSTGDYLAGQISTIQTWNQVVDPAQALTPASYYQRITPARFLDTRNGTGGTTGPRPANSSLNLDIAGVNGIPAANVTAVAMNVTVLSASAEGYISAWPDFTAQPATSNINFAPGAVSSGYIIVPVGTNGYINLFTAGGGGTIHLLADVSGYFTSDAAASGISSYTPITPIRFGNTITGAGGHSGTHPAGATRNYQIGGASGIPAGVTAVVANITAASATAASYLNTWQQGQTQPPVSGLQYPAGSAAAAMTVIPVNTANGQFSLYSGQQTHVLIDILGYFSPGTAGQKYHALGATRLLDTREDNTPLAGNATRYAAPGNAITAGNPTLIVNLMAVIPAAGGYLLAYPGSLTSEPPTSTLNFNASQTVSNTALISTGTSNTIAIRNGSNGYTGIIADCTGYFSAN